MRRSLFAVVLLATGWVAAPAAAQEGVAGTVHGHFVGSIDGDLGGALTGEVDYALGVFRLGGYFGVVPVPSDEDVRNRVFMPLALSVGIDLLGDVVGFSARARGGLWGGATQEVKLTAGGFIGGGAYMLFNLGGGVGVSVGLDVWGLLGDGETLLFAPGAGLVWSPPAPEAAGELE